MSEPKRPRIRFTLRTLAIVVTLVCCYAACWGPTKRDVSWHGGPSYPPMDVSATMPLVVGSTTIQGTKRCYHFWFFGYVAKLPFERELASAPQDSETVLSGAESEANSR